MGFRPKATVPSFSSLHSMGILNPITASPPALYDQNGGGAIGRTYIGRIWLPQSRSLVAIGFTTNAAMFVDIAVYSGSPSAGFTRLASLGATVVGAANLTNRIALASPVTLPSGTLWLAIGGSAAAFWKLFQPTDQVPAGMFYFVDGIIVGNALPDTIAGGTLTDRAGNLVAYPNPIAVADLEFA